MVSVLASSYKYDTVIPSLSCIRLPFISCNYEYMSILAISSYYVQYIIAYWTILTIVDNNI